MNRRFIKLWLIASLALSLVSVTSIANDSYILGPGDKVEIKVFGEDDLTIETMLSNSGEINYPFLGEIMVVGLTVKQVEQFIEKGLKGNYLVSPNVYAHVIEYRPFYIHGEVKVPGGFPYQPGMTINQAVALAGGLTERADTNKIWIFKEGDKSKKQKASLDFKVNAGDTVTIDQQFF